MNRSRAYKAHIINLNRVLTTVAKLCYPFLDEFTIKKISLMGKDYHQVFMQDIDPDNLEERFGGNLPDKVDNFWPPILD